MRASANSNPLLPQTRLRTRLWQRLVLIVFVAATRRIQRMRRPAALRFGRRIGALASALDSRRGRYADSNLRLAYGDTLSASDRKRLIRQVFEHWGAGTIEFLRGPSYDEMVMDSLVSAVEGHEHLEAVRAGGKGFIVVTGHLGNFEFLGRWMAAQGVPSTAIARAPGDPAFAAYLRGMREFGGNVVLPKGTSVRELLAVLKRGQVLTLGADQNSGDLFVPFFGVPAGTAAGPATLALRTGVPLLPTFCVLDSDDRYRIQFLPPVPAESTGDRNADVLRLTVAITEALETMVRRYPAQWLWLHNRWKSAFEEKNRKNWPAGYDFDAAWEIWKGGSDLKRPVAGARPEPAERKET